MLFVIDVTIEAAPGSSVEELVGGRIEGTHAVKGLCKKKFTV